MLSPSGTSAEHVTGHARPQGRIGKPPPVHQDADTGEVCGGQSAVLGVVGLNHGGIDRLAHVIRLEAVVAGTAIQQRIPEKAVSLTPPR